ncbi:MAG: hypothetical protein ACLTBV_22475 [Enterocloster bolteae]
MLILYLAQKLGRGIMGHTGAAAACPLQSDVELSVRFNGILANGFGIMSF